MTTTTNVTISLELAESLKEKLWDMMHSNWDYHTECSLPQWSKNLTLDEIFKEKYQSTYQLYSQLSEVVSNAE